MHASKWQKFKIKYGDILVVVILALIVALFDFMLIASDKPLSENKIWFAFCASLTLIWISRVVRLVRWVKHAETVLMDSDVFVIENMDADGAVTSNFWFHDLGGIAKGVRQVD